jgi:transcriptional regulator with XRE-family HTH domain
MSLESAGIKADEMAARLGVHRGTVTRWTHEVGAPPRGLYLEKWAEITGVPLAWLKGGDNSNSARRDTHGYAAPLAA